MKMQRRYLFMLLGIMITILLLLTAKPSHQVTKNDDWSATDRLYVFYWLGE